MFSIHPSKSEEAKSLKLQELDPPFGFLSACTGMVVVECSASGSVGSAAGSRHPDACRGSAWAPVHGHPRIGSPPHRCHNNQPSAICSPRGVAPADRGARGVSPPVRARTSRGSGCVSPAPPHPSASRPLQNGPGRNAALGGGVEIFEKCVWKNFLLIFPPIFHILSRPIFRFVDPRISYFFPAICAEKHKTVGSRQSRQFFICHQRVRK